MNGYPFRYRIFGHCVASQVPLDAVGAKDRGQPVIRFSFLRQSGRLDRWYHSIRGPRGQAVTSFARLDGGFLVRQHGIGDFRIDLTGSYVECQPNPGVSDIEAGVTFRSHILPFVLTLRGTVVLHGSAVQWRDHVLVFIGHGGAGKSTLAAAFVRSGIPLVSDDAVPLERRDGVFRVLPGPAELRLYEPSLAFLRRSRKPAIAAGIKRRITVDQARSRRTLPLGAIFVLSDRPSLKCVELRRLTAQQAIIALLTHCFRIETQDRFPLERELDFLAALPAEVPILALNYRRRLENLRNIVQRCTTAFA